ncbi:MAG TPA: methyltransferase domain-containing protein [Longimicrobiales bacterium]
MESGTSSRNSPPPIDRGRPDGPVAAPSHAALAALLDRYAEFRPAPLSPELRVFQARGLVEVWEAAERLAGRTLPPPFWAYPWPGGAALARVVLDHPDRIAGRRVLDLGTGGGIAALAAARAGAAEVVANDLDPWALATARLAADRQGLALTPRLGDLTADPGAVDRFHVVLCGDLAYERRVAPRIRRLLSRARRAGAAVLAADAGRAYFDTAGMRLIAEYTIDVPQDVEGVTARNARVYAVES